MPRRPKSICRRPSCSTAIDTPGYCDKHKQDATGWYKTSTKSSSERGYGANWRKKREQVLIRDCGLCQIRGADCRTVATEVDHKVSKAKARQLGWTDEQIDDESNLQSACVPCHKGKTTKERQ